MSGKASRGRVATTQRMLEHLRRRGLVYRRPGRGGYRFTAPERTLAPDLDDDRVALAPRPRTGPPLDDPGPDA